MGSIKDDIIRADKEFKKMLDEIKIAKIKNGTSRRMLSDRRLTLALTRVPNLKDFVIKEPLKEDLK